MWISAKHGMVELSTDTLAALQLRYPLANVEQEMLKYGLWLLKNPASRPKLPLRGCENWLKKCSPKAAMVDVNVGKWWQSEESTMKMAEKLGVATNPGEEWPRFRQRIRDALCDAQDVKDYRNQGRAA